MFRNEMFEIIRASQLEDNEIDENYKTCYRCNRLMDIYIKAYDKDENGIIFICKDCFCNSNSSDYCIPFSYLGESGYIDDNIGTSYWWDKYKRYYGLSECYNCKTNLKYGVPVYLRDSLIKPDNELERHYMCERCFKSQKWVSEELHINWYEKGLKVFNESKQRK